MSDASDGNEAPSLGRGRSLHVKDLAEMKKQYKLALTRVAATSKKKTVPVDASTYRVPKSIESKGYTMLLGSGAFGHVVLAQSNSSKEFVAVKILSGVAFLDSISQEASILRKIGKHPNIVEFRDVFMCDEDPHDPKLYIVTKYYPHGDLEMFRQAQPTETRAGVEYATLGEQDLKVVVFSVCRAFQYIHEELNLVSPAAEWRFYCRSHLLPII